MPIGVITQETVALTAPVNKKVNVYVSMTDDVNYENQVQFYTDFDEGGPQALPGGPYVTWDNGGVAMLGDPYANLAQGTLTVPGPDLLGFLTIHVRRPASDVGKANGYSDATLDFSPIDFYDYDPYDTGKTGTLSDVTVAERWVEAGGLCKCSVTLTTAAGDPVPGAEIQWSVVGTTPAWLYADAGGANPLPKPGKDYWATTTSDDEGTATVYVQSGLASGKTKKQSGALSLRVRTLGDGIGEKYPVIFYPSFDPQDITPYWGDSLSVHDNPYPLQGAKYVTLALPRIQSGYDGALSYAYIFMQTDSGKQEFVAEIPNMQQAIDLGYVQAPAALFERNDGGENTPVLWVINQDGVAYKSDPTSFEVTGDYENRPDTSLPNNIWISAPYPVPSPGVRPGGITYQNSLLPNNDHLKVQIDSALPDTYTDGTWQLYYLFFLNGSDGTERLFYYPDWSVGDQGITVTTSNANVYKSAMIAGNKCMGFTPPGSSFYCVCAVVPAADYLDQNKWVYCNYTYAKQDNYWTMDT